MSEAALRGLYWTGIVIFALVIVTIWYRLDVPIS
jgi:hypothetical protein